MQSYTVSRRHLRLPLCLLLSLHFFHSQHRLIECTFATSTAGHTLAASTVAGLAAQSRSSYLMDLSRRTNLPASALARSSNSLVFPSISSVSPISLSSTAIDSGVLHTHHLPNQIFDSTLELTNVALTQEMAPPDCYSNLFSKFKSVSQKLQTKISNPSSLAIKINEESKDKDAQSTGESVDINQLFRDSLMKANKKLVEEECENGDDFDMTGQSMNNGWQSGMDWQNSKGNSDFVYKTLRKTLENLDDMLDTVGHVSGVFDDIKTSLFYSDDQENSSPVDTPNETSLITRSKAIKLIERLKERAINYAVTTVKIKIKSTAQNLAAQEVASILNNHFDYPGNPMSYLEPMLVALNSNSIDLASNLLKNLPFRGALALINQINPMPFMKCKPKDKDPGPYC